MQGIKGDTRGISGEIQWIKGCVQGHSGEMQGINGDISKMKTCIMTNMKHNEKMRSNDMKYLVDLINKNVNLDGRLRDVEGKINNLIGNIFSAITKRIFK